MDYVKCKFCKSSVNSVMAIRSAIGYFCSRKCFVEYQHERKNEQNGD